MVCQLVLWCWLWCACVVKRVISDGKFVHFVSSRLQHIYYRILQLLIVIDWLLVTNLETLEYRRLHADLVMCYKIIFSLTNVDFCPYLSIGPSNSTRGHRYKHTSKHWLYVRQSSIIKCCPLVTSFTLHHRMQPLDLALFYDQSASLWLRSHPRRVISERDIGELFKEAYGKAAAVKNTTSEFLKSRIWPFNDSIFWPCGQLVSCVLHCNEFNANE